MRQPISIPEPISNSRAAAFASTSPVGLRFVSGRVYNGKFIFVHSRDLGFGQSDCPFRVQSFDELNGS